MDGKKPEYSLEGGDLPYFSLPPVIKDSKKKEEDKRKIPFGGYGPVG